VLVNSKRLKKALPAFLAAFFLLALHPGANAQDAKPASGRLQAEYVGSQACKQCHEDQYASYKANSKKAHSFRSVKKMRKGLTKEEYRKCFECHTTGYGKKGGFVSEEKTPHMANLGCEACHGPGAKHSKSESKADIKTNLTTKDCQICHNPERVESFKYRPLIFGGGH
jgi:hypothetical protein